jgi:hypothetical protein
LSSSSHKTLSCSVWVITSVAGVSLPHDESFFVRWGRLKRYRRLPAWGTFQATVVSYASEITPVALRGYLTTYVNLCWIIGQ